MTKAFLKHAVSDAVLINISAGIAHAPSKSGYSAYAAPKIANTMFSEYVQSEEPKLHIFNLHSGVILTAGGEKAVAEGVGEG